MKEYGLFEVQTAHHRSRELQNLLSYPSEFVTVTISRADWRAIENYHTGAAIP